MPKWTDHRFRRQLMHRRVTSITYLSTYLAIYYIYLSTCLSIIATTYLSAYLPIHHISIYLPMHHISIYLLAYSSHYLPTCLFITSIYLPIYHSYHISIYLFASLTELSTTCLSRIDASVYLYQIMLIKEKWKSDPDRLNYVKCPIDHFFFQGQWLARIVYSIFIYYFYLIQSRI